MADVIGNILGSTTAAMQSSASAAVSRVTAAKPKDLAAAEKTAKDFESVLLNRLMDEMQSTVPEGGILDSEASKQIQSLFWNQMSEEIGKKGGLGLWKQIAQSIAPKPQQPRTEIVR